MKAPGFKNAALCLPAATIVGLVWVGLRIFVPPGGTPSAQPTTAGSLCTTTPGSNGFPVHGVLYVPHMVGEPYPRPEARPHDIYSSTYSSLHKFDLPVIRSQLNADTLLLRPWPSSDTGPTNLFAQMRHSGLCKVIPTFHLAKHYVELLQTKGLQPDTSSNGVPFSDFSRFSEALVSNRTGGVRIIAWTVDLSLDVEALLKLPIDNRTCRPEPVKDLSYMRYKSFLEVLVNWVRQLEGSAKQALTRIPLLLPLDLSRTLHSMQVVQDHLRSFLMCFAVWSPTLFGAVEGIPRTRWLFSFSLPYGDPKDFDFGSWLKLASQSAQVTGLRLVVMVAAQALKADPNNMNILIEDYGNGTHPPRQQYMLRSAFAEYSAQASVPHSNLDGFILDEWQDDWDRGSRGPFFIALDSKDQMEGQCHHGGRFSHDAHRCARRVAAGYAYPEFFGLAESRSQALQHCIGPRFRKGMIFAFPRGNASAFEEGHRLPMHCAFVRPSFNWVICAGTLCAMILTMHICRGRCRCSHRGGLQALPMEDRAEVLTKTLGHEVIEPREPRLRGGHKIELTSTRFQSNEEAGWWLWSHLGVQMAILEKQVMEEVATRQALSSREGNPLQSSLSSSTSNETADSEAMDLSAMDEDLPAAMATIHRRALEGFSAWCRYVASSPLGTPPGVRREQLQELEHRVYENAQRSAARLFAEALLLRAIESLAEQIMHCPERLSHVLYAILSKAGQPGDDDSKPTVYSIDLDKLHSGLQEIHEHSNPYESRQGKDRQLIQGINFDDINECGIQCRDVTKTFKEPAGITVMLDFFLCYRVPFMIKLWALFIAGYIYLGTGFADTITSHNGDLFMPKWLRINFIQYTALADACIWCFIEASLVLHVAWQRWPSLGHRSPGVPNSFWFLEHLVDLIASAAGAWFVFTFSDFRRKPLRCRDLDSGLCEDPRSSQEFLRRVGLYWLCRIVVFALLHRAHTPVFLRGTPWRNASRNFTADMWNGVTVSLAWLFMIISCIIMEAYFMLPAMGALGWGADCGLNSVGHVFGVPESTGTCSMEDHWFDSSCVSCMTGIVLAGLIVFLCSLLDIYLCFYMFASLAGTTMGHQRHLNNLKHTSLVLDLRPGKGREAKRFEATFGPCWRRVWLMMVKSLFQESYISPRQFVSMVQAAGLTTKGDELVERRAERMQPINLGLFPQLVAERLAFFFRSLKWIEERGWPVRGMRLQGDSDVITSEHFNPGTVPSLTQIIPVCNETILPSVDFLLTGGNADDAMNQCPEGLADVGERTRLPWGSGVTTNLAFMISQFPNEWSNLSQRLYLEGQMKDPDGQKLYRTFTQRRLHWNVVTEVRLWAALRSQTVAKAVVGALQYSLALASLPAFQKLYSTQPNKRLPEDHCEVILAHQTFGQNPPTGNIENDKAAKLLLMRYAHAPLFLVFDLTPNSSESIWILIKTFLQSRRNYDSHSLQYASVKCRWKTDIKNLEILEVLPRMFPLRLGKGHYKTQGKAGNQLNALRFSSGYYLQALDCNMGAFIGESFKVPYMLRIFMPLDRPNRVVMKYRFLGCREYIYTQRNGLVGRCHAATEWTFSTICQRFLNALGARTDCGRPGFLDGFWARNRGGVSKNSATINLNKGIFVDYNVLMRGEASAHIDALEFENSCETSFNATSTSFAKFTGNIISVIRSRDNHLLCERIGIINSLSFYFTSMAFCVSNLIVDMSTYLYTGLFVFLRFGNIDLSRLSLLGSCFVTEWMISLGIVTIIPQLFEMILEYGASNAINNVLGRFFGGMGFFMFQNKNIASAMHTGAAMGAAQGKSPGRSMANANLHLTWRDIYVTYSKSHFQPAFSLLSIFCVYRLLGVHTASGSENRLPMMLVVVSFSVWFVMPIVFCPFPRLSLIRMDLQNFNGFINGRAGMEEEDLTDVIDRGREGKVRTLFEFGLADEIHICSNQPVAAMFAYMCVRIVLSIILLLSLPSGITDFLWIYVVVLSLQWVCVLGFFSLGLNNFLLILSFIIVPFTLWAGRWIIGHRATTPSMITRLPEYAISGLLFAYLLGLIKQCVQLFSRLHHCFSRWWSPQDEPDAMRRHQQVVRTTYVFFFVHQMHCLQAYGILLINTLCSLLLALLDALPSRLHTWWLLSKEVARRKKDKNKNTMPNSLELDDLRMPDGSESSDDDSEISSERSIILTIPDDA